MATTRSSSRSSADGRAIGSEDSMQRVVILGGGVGGTLTANLLARKLHRQIDRGEAKVTVIDRTGAHVYQPGFMYIAMGGERAEKPGAQRAIAAGHEGRADHGGRDPRRYGRRRGRTGGRDEGRLRPPGPGDRLPHRAGGDRALRRRGPSLLLGRIRPEAAARAGRLRRRHASSSASPGCPTSAHRLRSKSPS